MITNFDFQIARGRVELYEATLSRMFNYCSVSELYQLDTILWIGVKVSLQRDFKYTEEEVNQLLLEVNLDQRIQPKRVAND